MPELAEVETIRRELEPELVGKRIELVWWRRGGRVFRQLANEHLLSGLKGKRILKISRRGKYLLFYLSSGKILVIHLGMSGSLKLEDKKQKRDRHQYLELYFKDFRLSFRDPRTFGLVAILDENDFSLLSGLNQLGPEPLSKEFNSHWLKEKFHQRKAPVKSLLLDQRICAGVGNIYGDEACFFAGISPLRPAGSLSEEELKALSRSIKKVLKEAIAKIGTTIQSYQTSSGEPGGYSPRVYGREGEACFRCGRKIRRARLGNRSTYFCPGCQK